MAPDPLPVACTLTLAEIVERKASLLPGLAERAVAREPTPDGYRLQFEATSDVLQAITSTIDAERHCCPFLRFDLTVAQAGGPIDLTLSGPDGTRDFLIALLET